MTALACLCLLGGAAAAAEDVVQVVVMAIAREAARMRELREALWLGD